MAIKTFLTSEEIQGMSVIGNLYEMEKRTIPEEVMDRLAGKPSILSYENWNKAFTKDIDERLKKTAM